MDLEDILETGLGIGLGLGLFDLVFGETRMQKAERLIKEAYHSGRITKEKALEMLEELHYGY